MEKTAKITSVLQNTRTYTGKNGPIYIHKIEFEGDGNSWEYHSTSPTCDKFISGQEATFTTEVSTNGQYINYKIKPAQQSGKKFGGGGYKKSSFEQALILTQSSTKLVNEIFVAGKIDLNKYQETLDWMIKVQIEVARKYEDKLKDA